MKLTAVMMVRDEVDVVATTIAHHRSLGVDEVLVVDNGSTDGTAEVLAELAAADPAVLVRADPGPYHQPHVTSLLAREAFERGADWVLPVDADELWWVRSGDLRAVLADVPAHLGGLTAEVVNFVQHRERRDRVPGALTTMGWRALAVGEDTDAERLVTSGHIGFVEMRYPPKVVVRPSADLVIERGAHGAHHLPGPLCATHDLEVHHAPVRAFGQLALRAEQGRRVHEVDPDRSVGWHVKRVVDLEREGRLEDEWRANTADDGHLDLPDGRHRALVPDGRLAEAASAAGHRN